MGQVFSDEEVQNGKTYYYWIRFVSEDGIAGPFHSESGYRTETAPEF